MGVDPPTAEAVHAALWEEYPDDDEICCVDCGFGAPDNVEIPTCPGCGATFYNKGETSVTAEAAIALPRKRLDNLEGQFNKFRDQATKNFWNLGRVLSEILDSGLWKDEQHKTFAEYVESKLQFSARTGKRMMSIYRTYTEKEIVGLSPHHLDVIASVKEEAPRREIMTRAREEGLSVRALRREIRDNVVTELKPTTSQKIRIGVKPGKIGQPEWRNVRKKRMITFEIDGLKFTVEDTGDSAIVKAIKPKDATA